MQRLQKEELILFPLPIPMRARTFVALLAAIDVFSALYFTNSEVAHVAHAVPTSASNRCDRTTW